MISKNNGNNNTVLATLALMLLSLSVVSWIAISTPHYASAQGVLEGLEREQSGEGVPGGQSADTGGAVPLNDTTTAQPGDVQGGGNATNATMTGAAGNATNATMTGAAGNATTTGDGGTTAGGNQTGGGQ
jgi:hypothetical protein